MKGRYPLDALGRLRRRTVDERAREVAERVRSAERAVQAVQATRRERQAEAGHARTVSAAEQARVVEGQARAGDLARNAEWALGAALRQAELERREQEADARLQAEKRAEALARGALARADADDKAVAKHEQRWRREQEARVEAEQDETAGEAWLARRGKP